jgi:PIN domain nuclease of toxin-antitoxin system
LATKVRLGKWDDARATSEAFDTIVSGNGFVVLPISPYHARIAGSWPVRHGDPFDRMLAAQAQIEDAPLVTADPVFKEFGIRTIW